MEGNKFTFLTSIHRTPQASGSTREKAEIAKKFIENKYAKLKTEEQEKKEGKTIPLLNSDIAWDKLNKQMEKMNLSSTEKELIKQEIQHREAELFRMRYVCQTILTVL